MIVPSHYRLLRKLSLLSAALIVLSLSVKGTAHAQLNVNLIQNPGAEAGMGAPDDSVVTSIPSWDQQGSNFTVTAYSAPEDLSTSSPGYNSSFGNNYFYGGPGNTASLITQTVSLDPTTIADVATGNVLYSINGYFGGYDGQDDNMTLTAIFSSAAGDNLGESTIGGYLSADRGGVTELLFASSNGTAPVGTTSVTFTLNSTRISGSDDDGLADNLLFELTSSGAVPEPGSLPLLAVAGLSLGMRAYRRKLRVKA